MDIILIHWERGSDLESVTFDRALSILDYMNISYDIKKLSDVHFLVTKK
jgi:hypothetical protein